MKAIKGAEHEEEDGEHNAVDLPQDITDFIIATLSRRFALKDVIRSSLVCRSWLSIASSESALCEPPWIHVTERSVDPTESNRDLVFCSYWGKGDVKYEIHRLPGFPIRTRTSTTQASNCQRTCLLSSECSWLLIACVCRRKVYNADSYICGVEHPLSLYNPFTRDYFELPTFSPPKLSCCRYKMRSLLEIVVFSHRDYNRDLVVVVSYSNVCLCKLKDGDGDGWSYFHNQRHVPYINVMFRQERQLLYAIDAYGGIDVLRIECRTGVGLCLCVAYSVKVELGCINRKFTGVFPYLFLVEHRRDVLLITADLECSDVNVYELEEGDASLKRVRSIGDRALFVALGCGTFSVAAKYCPRLDENHVYVGRSCMCKCLSVKDGAVKMESYISLFGLRRLRYSAESGMLIAPPPLTRKPSIKMSW